VGITLLEAAKQMPADEIRRALIEVFVQQVDILKYLPFNTITGTGINYSQEDTLPGIAYRGIDATYTPSAGVINPLSDPLKELGGELDVDNFIIKTLGEGVRSQREAMKMKALGHTFAYTFIKGDSTSTPAEFDGLQLRLTGSQLISSGSTSGGDALSLAKLDELIDAVDNPTHLIMTKAVRRALTVAARTTTVGGDLQWRRDDFGVQNAFYANLPILIADQNGNSAPALAYDEAGAGGGSSVCTSIYCVSFGDDMLSGIQNSPPDARDLGELQASPGVRTRVDWLAGMAVFHPRCAARLYGIKSATVTV